MRVSLILRIFKISGVRQHVFARFLERQNLKEVETVDTYTLETSRQAYDFSL